ncbi:hypothetical protein AURDEDRAFT_187989 [Auricularia subglabra TFB-10046 SS5]|uniref:Uncharacterized protein n=1 Tax=Auricularia subglabra (strain TFB-10046 / SS5) TaxID=717982 RepID=J0WWD2_AURST|nr:hypothetical protein AURDEDRAFT_187989 [Auricularia subglabra TFB-10046 SS5]
MILAADADADSLDDGLLDALALHSKLASSPRIPRRGIVASPPSSESSVSSSSSRGMADFPFAALLRDAGVLYALGAFLSWGDLYAALSTCRAARGTFDRPRTKDALLRRYVPGYARGVEAPFVPLVDMEHLVLFMLSQAEPLHRYPALALALLSGAALGPPSPEDDARAHKLEQLALAHSRMVLLLRARAPPLAGAETEDPVPPAPRAAPAERELAFPAPLAYFGEGAAPPANTGTTPPAVAAPTSSASPSSASPASAPATLRHREGAALQKHNSNRLSRIFSAAPKAPPPAPQRDKRFWEDMRRERRNSRHAHSQSLGDVDQRRIRQSMYGLRALGGSGSSDALRSLHDPALAASRARALVLRLFVPCARLDGDALAECESQLRDEGFWPYLQPGDALCNLGFVPDVDTAPAWIVYTGERLAVWTPAAPAPVAPDAALRLPSPFYFAHLAPSAGGSQPPSGLTSRASMYSVAAPLSASTPTLGNQAPFFAALSLHRRPGSSGGGPPSAWTGFGGAPAPSIRTSAGGGGSSGGHDPRWVLRVPALPPANWVLAQQLATAHLKPRMGMQSEVGVRRHVWLAVVDLRRISIPPVPPLPDWARGSKVSPSNSAPALPGPVSPADSMGAGWQREWVLEAAGTPEGRAALEAILAGTGGEREWIVMREKCAPGRLWMRLVDWPAFDPEADGMTSPHERLAMTPTLPPRAPLEVDLGRPLEFSLAAAGTARAQQQQMQLNQPPPRRVVSQPPPPRRLSKRNPSPSPARSRPSPSASSQSLEDPQKTPMPSAWQQQQQQQQQPWPAPAPARYSSPPVPSGYSSPPPSMHNGLPPTAGYPSPPPSHYATPTPSRYTSPAPVSAYSSPPPQQPVRLTSPPPQSHPMSPSSTSSSLASLPPFIHTTPPPNQHQHQPQQHHHNGSPPRSPHSLAPSPVKRTSSPLNPKNQVQSPPPAPAPSTSGSSLHSPSSASLSSSVATPPSASDVPPPPMPMSAGGSKMRALPPGAAPPVPHGAGPPQLPQPPRSPPVPPKQDARQPARQPARTPPPPQRQPSNDAPPPPPPKLSTSNLRRDSSAPMSAPTSPPMSPASQVSKSGSVFGPATGLLPPPPPKTPSRKLTRKRVVSAFLPGR